MSVPAFPQTPVPQTPIAPPAKLPWWDYVKASYADAWRDAPDFIKAGSLCLLLQVLFLYFSPPQQTYDVNAYLNEFSGQLNGLADATPEKLESLLQLPGNFLTLKDALLNTLEHSSLSGFAFLLWLPMRIAFYRRYVMGAPIRFVNPLAIGRKEWSLAWETLNVFWYLILPSLVFVVALTFVSIFGSVLAIFVGGLAALLVVPLVLWIGFVLLVWILTRFTVLSCALPGVVETRRLRMWNDVWLQTKPHHNALLWGISFVPPEMLYGMAQGLHNGKTAPTPVLALLETVLVMIGWLVLGIARASFEARCYAYLKNEIGKPQQL